jgi:hypothetical protein
MTETTMMRMAVHPAQDTVMPLSSLRDQTHDVA